MQINKLARLGGDSNIASKKQLLDLLFVAQSKNRKIPEKDGKVNAKPSFYFVDPALTFCWLEPNSAMHLQKVSAGLTTFCICDNFVCTYMI